jgi:hypothetical protein
MGRVLSALARNTRPPLRLAARRTITHCPAQRRLRTTHLRSGLHHFSSPLEASGLRSRDQHSSARGPARSTLLLSGAERPLESRSRAR